jgi:hypothetical protein
MKPDEVVFFICIVIGTWYFGFLYGQSRVECLAPMATKKLSVDGMTKQSQRVWAKYLANRGM